MIFSKRVTHVVVALMIAFSFIFIWTSADTHAQPIELIILHQNDFHGRLDTIVVDNEPRGGVARLAGIARDYRTRYPNRVLWLDGGDTWHGTLLANVFHGQPVVDAFNVAGLDAMVLGNHEFNYDQETIQVRAEQARFAVLSANTIRLEDGYSIVAPYTIFELDGVNVAVFGLTTPDTPWAAHPKTTVGLTFLDPVEAATALVPTLKEKADLVVALTHIGFDEDQRLARLVPEIDIIVGGHSHTKLSEPVQIGDTIIVQAHEHGKYLGALRLLVEDGRVVEYEGQLIPVTPDSPVDLGVADELLGWSSRLEERFQTVVGEAAVLFDGEPGHVRTQQTNLGRLVANLMRDALGELNGDFALLNSGSIRQSIHPGPVTLADVYNVLPFDNTLVGLELTGEQVYQAIEHGVIAYPQTWGGFLHTSSGLEYTFDPNRPAGERIQAITFNGQPLDHEAKYVVATSDFIANGGDGYDMLVGAPRLFGTEQSDGPFLRDLLHDHFEAVGIVTEPELTPEPITP